MMTETGRKIKGVCKWFHEKKGYGFVVDDQGQSYFAHFSEIEGTGHRVLFERQPVEFIPASNFRGLRATHIVRLDKSE